MKSHHPELRIDFRHFNEAKKILTSYRKKFLTNICLARNEIFRLKKEISTLPNGLPYGSCIGNYTTSYDDVYGNIRRYQYHALSHKNPVFPKIKGEKFSKKLHLGRVVNPHYREALTLIEVTRIREIKLETLEQITVHLNQLKSFYFSLSRGTGWSKKYQRKNPDESAEMSAEDKENIRNLSKEFPDETLIEKLKRLGFWEDGLDGLDDEDDVDEDDESIG